MSVLSDDLEIRPNQRITVVFDGLAPLTTSEALQGEIGRVFSGTSFKLERVEIPTLFAIRAPYFVGYFKDQGGGYSLPSRNIKVAEAKLFFLDRLNQVEGLTLAVVRKIEAGVVATTGPFGVSQTTITVVLVIAGVVAVGSLIAQVRPLVGK